MMWKEFEELAGYEVTFEDYNNIIEPMYMATNMSKQEFIKCIDKKRFAIVKRSERTILNQIKKIANELKETCEHYKDWDKENQLEDLVKELRDTHYKGFCYTIDRKHTMRGCRGCTFPAIIAFWIPGIYNYEKQIEIAKAWYEE